MSGFTVTTSNSTEAPQAVLRIAAAGSRLSRRQINACVFLAKEMRASSTRAFFEKLRQTLARIVAGPCRTSGSLLRQPAAAGN